MPIRLRDKSLLAGAAFAAALAVVPAQASAAAKPSPVDVTATIAACRGETITVAAQIEPSADVPKRKVKRATRRATLKLRFEAAPLFGPTKKSREFDLGHTTNARHSVRFGDLPAQSYSGIVRYRWKRGKRTVVSGVVRTQKALVAGHRGKAFCSLRVGKRPVDTTPPVIVPVPSDSRWYRGPLNVGFFVFDDLSGVKLVASRVDGGAFARGRATSISGQGAHTLEYLARDAAGNQTPVRAITLRVDQGAPTPPVVTGPTGSTTDSTPIVTWNAASDSGSGIAGYIVLVRNSGGAIAFSHEVNANAPRSAAVTNELPPGTYTAEVLAYDATVPEPFTATGSSSFSVAQAPPGADSDGDGIVNSSDNCDTTPNPSQDDVNGDGVGDACDDSDGDGLTDAAEINGNPQTLWNDPDTDNDGVPDGSEGAQGTSPVDPDSDNDGFDDSEDPCPATFGVVC